MMKPNGNLSSEDYLDLTTPDFLGADELVRLFEDTFYHDSRSLGDYRGRDRDSIPGGAVEPLWGFDDPEPLEWFVKDLLPAGFPTILAADGGIGKSYVSVYLALCVILGKPFFSREVRQGSVLFVDYELDADEQRRRVLRILRGLGLDQHAPVLREQFHYYRPLNPLCKESGHDEVIAVKESVQADLIILDSLTIAMAADASSQNDVVKAMRRFKEWGTVLAIDHISGASAAGNQAHARPFGSVFKRNISRSVLGLSKADGDGLMLRANKANFGPPAELLCFEMMFSDNGETVNFEARSIKDEAMIGAERNLTTYEMTLLAVETLSVGATAEDVSKWREDRGYPPASAPTIGNHFTALKKRSQIVVQDGKAYPLGFVAGSVVDTPKGLGKVFEGKNPEAGRYPVRLQSSGEVVHFAAEDLTAHDSRSSPPLGTVNRDSARLDLGEVAR